MAKQTFPANYAFEGFETPTFTAVPDVVFDYFLPRLAGSELKVLMYIIRRTLGFKKNKDNISLNQLVNGITTQDGRVLDEGTGLSMPSVIKAVKELEKKNIILAKRNRSQEKGDEATTYILHFKDKTNSNNLRGGSKKTLEGGLKKVKTQQTVLQKTDVVVVSIPPSLNLLESYGMHYGIAEQLAMGYPQEYIEEKVAILKALPKAPDNPAGWLRRAIEQNYTPPKPVKKASSKSKKAAKTALKAKKGPTVSDTANEDDWRLPEPSEPAFDGPAKMKKIWKTAYNELELQLPKEAFDTWLRPSHILAYKNGVITIGVHNKYAREWLEQRLKKPILRVLQQVAKDKTLDVHFTLLSREDE